MRTATVRNIETNEGVEVKVGDYVGFKCDIEQSGKIVEIKTAGVMSREVLVLESEYGFHGEYIGGETRTEEFASDCWVD